MAEFKWRNSYARFATEVRRDRRYFRSADTEAFIEAVRTTATARASTMPAGFNRLWRAQLWYCGPHIVNLESHDREVIDPYPKERMKPREGRASCRRLQSSALMLANRANSCSD